MMTHDEKYFIIIEKLFIIKKNKIFFNRKKKYFNFLNEIILFEVHCC
jgi:hypothetical protein